LPNAEELRIRIIPQKRWVAYFSVYVQIKCMSSPNNATKVIVVHVCRGVSEVCIKLHEIYRNSNLTITISINLILLEEVYI
jgi:hypothetical protein